MTLFRSLKQKLVALICLAVLAVFAFLIVGISVSILQRQSTSPLTRRFVNVVPVPAASVDGSWLLYRDVLARWDDIDRSLTLPIEPGMQRRPVAVLRQEAYEQLIRQTYLKRQAAAEKFVPSEEIIQQNLERVLLQGATSTPALLAEAAQALQDHAGWNLDTFRDRIIRPATLEEALALRAEVGGMSREDWLRQVQTFLGSGSVKRYLTF